MCVCVCVKKKLRGQSPLTPLSLTTINPILINSRMRLKKYKVKRNQLAIKYAKYLIQTRQKEFWENIIVELKRQTRISASSMNPLYNNS